MATKENSWLAFLTLLGAVILWGGNWVAVRYAVQEMSPLIVVTIRTVLSAIILLLALRVTGGKQPVLRDLRVFALLGLVGIFGFNLMQFVGLKYTTAINGSLINAATPILTVVLSRLLLGERLRPLQLLGVVISFVGVVWVATDGSWAVLSSLKFNTGDLMIFLAAACWSIYTIYGRKPTLKYSSLAVTAYASLFAAVYFIPLGLNQYRLQPVSALSWAGIIAIGYSVLVGVFALVAWLKGVSIVGPSRASIYMNLLPLFTLVLASLLLGEQITLNHLAGGFFVLGGVYLTTSPRFVVKPAT